MGVNRRFSGDVSWITIELGPGFGARPGGQLWWEQLRLQL